MYHIPYGCRRTEEEEEEQQQQQQRQEAERERIEHNAATARWEEQMKVAGCPPTISFEPFPAGDPASGLPDRESTSSSSMSSWSTSSSRPTTSNFQNKQL